MEVEMIRGKCDKKKHWGVDSSAVIQTEALNKLN